MISPYARPFVAAGLSQRLFEVERALAGVAEADAGQLEPAGDPEEALREVMVQHLPRAHSMNADRRARVCGLLAGLAREARRGDVRFLDALNTWFERVGVSWQADPAWRRVAAAYAAALRAVISDLQKAESSAVPPGSQWSIQAAREAVLVRPANPRVLVLAGHWAAAWRIVREVRRVSGLTVHILICNDTAASTPAFALRQLAAALTAGVHGLVALFVAVCQGRVHVRRRGLHAEGTLLWLSTERFWIGLHAMGVIYRDSVFKAFGRGVLNSHIGLLPEYRGRSVMEWSILAGAPTGISVFFMDSGIDTGREIVLRRPLAVSGRGCLEAKASLFNRDGEMYRAALEILLEGSTVAEPVNEGGHRYFVMSRLLTRTVDALLASGASEIVWETNACTSMA